MARGSTKDKNGVPAATGENPEVAERKRLKNLALTKSMLSESAAKPLSLPLTPSKTVLKHHGRDILKKSQRKNRYLFSFPGLLGPISGGKIGELKDLGTKNPILYLEFPQGQVKLFGTIVYPKNRYLTLQFSRGGKNVMCEDYFDNMIIFSDAWWIGRKGENPDEARLEFPKEINEGQLEYDFKGGAGAAPVIKQKVEEESPNADLEDAFTDGENNLKDMEATPVRHSVRTARKTYNFAERSFQDDSVEDADELAEGEENKDTVANNHSPQQIQESSLEKSKNLFGSSMTKSGGLSSNNHGSLVQASISTFFKKAEEKKEETTIRKPASPKVSSMKLQHANTKRKKDQVEGSRKKAKVIDERKAGTQIRLKEKKTENPSSVDSLKAYKRKTETSDSSNASASVEEDDIEVFSCTSEEDDDKDEDWAG